MDERQFLASKEGKCATCGEKDTLDAMLRKEGRKGVYECTDCIVERESAGLFAYAEPLRGMPSSASEHGEISKTRRLFAWCFG